MSKNEPLIFEVSSNNFDTAVIFNSHKMPVLVEFLGVWSEHSMHLEQHLVMMAKEFPGQFIFAKVDVDEQQELRKQYGIDNVPILKVFKDGEVIRSEEGLLQEHEVRALLKDCGIYRESDGLRELAREKHIAGETLEAINILTQAIQSDPSNTRIALDMVQIFLDIGELDQAKSLYNRLPDSDQKSDTGRALLGQLTFKELAANTAGKDELISRLGTHPDDHDAAFELAVCLVAEHNYQAAMEQLFSILEQQPDYKDGAAREMIANLTNMLAPNEPQLAQEFRRRLSNLLS